MFCTAIHQKTIFCVIAPNKDVLPLNRLLPYMLLLVLAQVSVAQSVLLTDISADSLGRVSLQWSYNGNARTFVSYQVQKMDNTSRTYATVSTISDFSTTTYTDSLSNASTDTVKYRVAVYDSSFSVSDSATTILASVQNISMQNVVAMVSWNPPFGSNPTRYDIYRLVSGRQWQMIGSTTMTRFFDTIMFSVCGDTIYYKVEGISAQRAARSTADKAAFRDPLPTSTCSLDVVTVNPNTGQIELSWLPSPDRDIMGYFICQGSPCMALDTIWGQNTLTYVAANHSTDSVNSYRIYAFDSCFTASALTVPYNNMVLEMSSRHCTQEITFTWNEYLNMPGGLDHYALHVRYDGGNYRQVGTVPAASPRNYTHTVPAGVRRVYAYVEAVNASNSKFSKSNIRVFDMMNSDTADFIHIKSVSVNDDNSEVELKFYVDNQFAADSYKLYRKTDVGQYSFFETIPFTGQEELRYADANVDANLHTYAYCLTVMDECELLEKPSLKTPHIVADLLTGTNENTVTWTRYSGFGKVLYYNVCRKNGRNGEWIILTTVTDTTQTSYVDNLGPEDLQGKRLFYKVVAYVTYPGTPLGDEFVQSQTVDHVDDVVVLVPNAFTPRRNNNRVFKPTLLYVKEEGYLFQVYSRKGLLVFSTTDISIGWDGKHKGEYVPNGCYVYLVKCLGEKGFEKVEKGSFLLVE